MLLNDKIALVTGSTHNIGLAVARAFAREGAKVMVHSRHEDDAKKIAREIRVITSSLIWPSPSRLSLCWSI